MRLAAAATLLALLLLAPVASAAGENVQTLGPGQVYLPEALIVGADTTLRLRPGTTLHGPGHVQVYGALEADGTIDAGVVLRVPLMLDGDGDSRLRNATVESIGGAAVTVRNGSLTVERTTFRDNQIGLVAAGAAAVLHVRDSTFHGHGASGLRIDSAALARLDNVTLRDNPVGLLARLDGSAPLVLDVDGSRFEENPDHVRLDFGATPNPGAHVHVRGSTFRVGAIVILSDLSSAPASPDPPQVLLERNHIAQSEVGMTVRGAGYRVVSVNDTFEGNRIGISAAGADLTLRDARFSSLERDLDLDDTVRLALDGAVLSAVSEATPPPPPGGSGPWAYALGALLVGGGGLAFWRRRRLGGSGGRDGADTSHSGADAAAVDVAVLQGAAPPAAAADDIAARLAQREWTELEIRILHDIHAHPGTPQTEVARRLGLSRQALHYHVKKLAEAGAVRKTPNGRTTECRIAPALRLPPLPPAVTQQGALEKG